MSLRSLFLPVVLLAAVTLSGSGCAGEGGREGSLGGVVLHGENGYPAAKVEVYLESGRFGRSSPFAVAYSDESGSFSLELPRGKYYLVARAEDPGGGRLFGEFAGNPAVLGKKGAGKIVIPLGPALESMEYRGPADSGVEGRALMGDRPAVGSVSLQERPAAGGYVYVYESDRDGLMGPGYLAARRVDEGGFFRIQLHPGRYWVSVRLKADGARAGYLAPGDYTGLFAGNPVVVPEGAFSSLGKILLHPVDPQRLDEAAQRRLSPEGVAGFEGIVLDREGEPVSGLFVLLYDHPQMIGRPLAMTTSDNEGRFRVAVRGRGEYYLGARESRSGPRSPGETAGGYEGTPDHSVRAEDDRWLTGLVIRVEEVW